ncbi:MAG TPA: selenocysteine-specific translation elongation factor [bacterium]|nr:selenocysteine-specific translation elongation factor [bacterium]
MTGGPTGARTTRTPPDGTRRPASAALAARALSAASGPAPDGGVIGTAGHIDHGKSALVTALTGIDPDRLEEEKRRGMTIDLGFAHLDLPGGRRVGVVDVPGHERLVKNMLAGAAGLDLVLLVIAADEGVMPQTREHLDILRFLHVRRGLVVLNKMDLATEPDWLALVEDDVRALCAGTFLEGAPVLRVSARTGAGLPELVTAIGRALEEAPRRDLAAPARLPVDRSFTMEGFGTVVTGTLWSGRIRAGDALELLPGRRVVRVRGVQSHGAAVAEAAAGQRVALNLAGVGKDEVGRGDVLATPGTIAPAHVIDARLRLLGDAPPLRDRGRVRMYIAADEVIGRVRLPDRAHLAPGESAVAQIVLERPAVALRGDPFVLRRYSPMTTIGGGEVIAAPAALRRRGAAAAAEIEALETSGLDVRILGAIRAAGAAGTSLDALAPLLGEGRERVAAEADALTSGGRVLAMRGRLFAAAVAAGVRDAILRTLAAGHEEAPWRVGVPREELKARAFAGGDDRLYGHVFDALAESGEVELAGGHARVRGFVPRRSAADEAAARAIEDAYREGRYAPPDRADALARTTDRVAAERMLVALLDEGVLVDAGAGVVFHRDALADVEARVRAHLERHGEITVASLRDLLGNSRKFTLVLLEYFDARHVTRRVGDKRVPARVTRGAGT